MKLFRRRAKKVANKYLLCRAMGDDKLQAHVNRLLSEGWQLSGGVCADGQFYVQALKK